MDKYVKVPKGVIYEPGLYFKKAEQGNIAKNSKEIVNNII